MKRHRSLIVAEALRDFLGVVDRVFSRGESVVLVRAGVPVARLVPPGPMTTRAAEMASRWDRLPHLDRADAGRFAEEIEVARRGLVRPADGTA